MAEEDEFQSPPYNSPTPPWQVTDWGEVAEEVYERGYGYEWVQYDGKGLAAVYAERDGQRWFAVRLEAPSGGTARYQLLTVNGNSWVIFEGEAIAEPDDPWETIVEASEGSPSSMGTAPTVHEFKDAMGGKFY